MKVLSLFFKKSRRLLYITSYIISNPTDLHRVLLFLLSRKKRRQDRRIIYISPRAIKYTIYGKDSRKENSRITFGNWDLKVRVPHDEVNVTAIRTINQLFVEGYKPEETDEYKIMVKRVRQGKNPHLGYGPSEDEIRRYFKDLESAYYNIKEYGYKEQALLGNPDGQEINIFICSDGEIASLPGGKHRTQIAKILGLKKVPVCVKKMHFKWVGKLERFEA